MVAWGPIIGAGISAISSLFGDDDEKTTETTINYKKMAREAEKAGFNPLTAIRNGGSAGFVTTHHPALSMEDRLGGVFSTLGNALMSFDSRAEERAELENKMLQAQLEQIGRQNDAANRSWFGDVPVAMGASVVGADGRPAGGLTPGQRTATNPWPVGSGIAINPRLPDAEMAETRYGDIVQEVFGVGTLAGDVYQNLPAAPKGSVVTRKEVNDAIGPWIREYEKWRYGTPNPKPTGTTLPRRPYSPTPGYNPHSLAY